MIGASSCWRRTQALPWTGCRWRDLVRDISRTPSTDKRPGGSDCGPRFKRESGRGPAFRRSRDEPDLIKVVETAALLERFGEAYFRTPYPMSRHLPPIRRETATRCPGSATTG